MRPEPLLNLLKSVQEQTLYPDEILIVDGSPDNKTELLLKINNIEKLKYFCVEEKDRGLTRQRNYGISKVNIDSEIVCFLDDDVVLDNKYFEFIRYISSFQMLSGLVVI